MADLTFFTLNFVFDIVLFLLIIGRYFRTRTPLYAFFAVSFFFILLVDVLHVGSFGTNVYFVSLVFSVVGSVGVNATLLLVQREWCKSLGLPKWCSMLCLVLAAVFIVTGIINAGILVSNLAKNVINTWVKNFSIIFMGLTGIHLLLAGGLFIGTSNLSSVKLGQIAWIIAMVILWSFGAYLINVTFSTITLAISIITYWLFAALLFGPRDLGEFSLLSK